MFTAIGIMFWFLSHDIIISYHRIFIAFHWIILPIQLWQFLQNNDNDSSNRFLVFSWDSCVRQSERSKKCDAVNVRPLMAIWPWSNALLRCILFLLFGSTWIHYCWNYLICKAKQMHFLCFFKFFFLFLLNLFLNFRSK